MADFLTIDEIWNINFTNLKKFIDDNKRDQIYSLMI